MHELGIATAVLQQVEAEFRRRPGARFTKVGLRIGEVSGVDPEALSFGFEALVKDTRWEGLALEIDYCPRQQRCLGCGAVFQARDMNTDCPRCGELNTICVSGNELDIAYLEMEDE